MPELMQAAAKGIFVDGDKVLILRAEDMLPHWDFPGGRLEANETIEEGLAREISEELPGVADLKIIKLLHACKILRMIDSKPMIGMYYLVSGNTKDLTLSHEHVGYKWITKKDLKKLEATAKLFDCDKTALELALN